MSDDLQLVSAAIEREHKDKSASTRRQMVAGAAATLGGLGLLGLPGAARGATSGNNDPQTILNVAATAEVLATIVNTLAYERRLGGDPRTQRNLRAAAREELIHYQVLVATGARALTKKIWIPDYLLKNRLQTLQTIQGGDQIFINAYLIGTRTFGNAGNGKLAAIAAEFMGVEAVHRALARQSLNLLGNDRVFMKFDQKETAFGAPNVGQPGFTDILGAVAQLQKVGFGFGAKGKGHGRFYDFDIVSKRTPTDRDLNTFAPSAG